MQKRLIGASWPLMRRLMIAGMDLGSAQGQDAKRIIDSELSWLDGLLSDSRAFSVGDRFSRADLTAASLLAPLAAPPGHPVYAELRWPPRLAVELAHWAQRPSIQWVRNLYANHR